MTMLNNKIIFSLFLLTFCIFGQEIDISNIESEDETIKKQIKTYNESILEYADKFPMKVLFKDGLPETFNFDVVKENPNIHLNYMLEKIIDDTVYLETSGFYNLNTWANPVKTYDSWIPEKEVNVLLFLFDSKNKRWIGGNIDTVHLSTVMVCSFGNIYEGTIYKSWPRFKKKITINHVFKICVYDRDSIQRSTFAYSSGAVSLLKSFSEQERLARK